jgi:hypothetical protein
VRDLRKEEDKNLPLTFLETVQCAALIKAGIDLTCFLESNTTPERLNKALIGVAQNLSEAGLKLTGLITPNEEKHKPGILSHIKLINSIRRNEDLELFNNGKVVVTTSSEFLIADPTIDAFTVSFIEGKQDSIILSELMDSEEASLISKIEKTFYSSLVNNSKK